MKRQRYEVTQQTRLIRIQNSHQRHILGNVNELSQVVILLEEQTKALSEYKYTGGND